METYDQTWTQGQPYDALVSQTYADQHQVRVGDTISVLTANLYATPVVLHVGAIVREFPTLYPVDTPDGFVVIDYAQFNQLVSTTLKDPSRAGANEFWLRTTGSASAAQTLTDKLNQDPSQSVQNVFSLQQALTDARSNPVTASMRGLLLLGAGTAILLAVLAGVVQALVAARQRTTQFAVLRTLGMPSGQLTRVLLGEQLTLYGFALVGGTLLGAVLMTATLPYLQFSEGTVDPAHAGVPPYTLVVPPRTLLEFYAALAVALLLALLLVARYASHVGLGKALRIGED